MELTTKKDIDVKGLFVKAGTLIKKISEGHIVIHLNNKSTALMPIEGWVADEVWKIGTEQ